MFACDDLNYTDWTCISYQKTVVHKGFLRKEIFSNKMNGWLIENRYPAP